MQIGRKDGEPWGRVTPRYLVDVMGVERQNLHYHLKELVRVGYLEKPVDGLYELVDDPRKE